MTDISASLITDLPDCEVDIESMYFLVSSAGEGNTPRLEFFKDVIFPQWYEKHFSMHQLSEYVSQFGIEIWSAPDVQLTEQEDKEPYAFYFKYTKENPGDVLVQCELLRRHSVN